MFNKYIRYFNQNRGKVIIIAFAVILTFVLIQTLNEIAKSENTRYANQVENKVIIEKEIKKSVIDEGATSIDIAQESKSIINNFVEYCNAKKTSEAYKLLSDDCKNILFPTETDFINNYYNIVFNSFKQYEVENWISNGNFVTYKIRYTNDVLAQGGYKSEYTIEDYYTIVKQEKDYKLNINKFVNREQINKSQSKDNFTINILARENYIDYQIYEVDFNNKSNYSIKTYDVSKNSSWNVVDANGLQYSAFLDEIADNNLIIESEIDKKIKIKYSKIYNLNRKVKRIEFNNMYFEGNPELFSFIIEI